MNEYEGELTNFKAEEDLQPAQQIDNDSLFKASRCSTEYYFISHVELNDLIRDFNLSKSQSELLECSEPQPKQLTPIY